MPAFALRFVGQEALPPRLSEFDREQFFSLTSADVAALREQFRSDRRLPAALMLMFMRVAGRPLDGFNVLPRNLLRHTAQVLAVSPPSIASCGRSTSAGRPSSSTSSGPRPISACANLQSTTKSR